MTMTKPRKWSRATLDLPIGLSSSISVVRMERSAIRGTDPVFRSAPCGLRTLHHAVAQHADPLDLELDHVARLEEAHVLEAAAVADRSGREELARVKRLRPRHVGDAILELPSHLARVAPP